MTPETIEIITALFIIGMIWLRTRMQYAAPDGRSPRLQRAGWVYFGCALVAVGAGWFLAPWLGHIFWPAAAVSPTLTRVVWCLATYYVFILVHRLLRGRGAEIFEHPKDAHRPSRGQAR